MDNLKMANEKDLKKINLTKEEFNKQTSFIKNLFYIMMNKEEYSYDYHYCDLEEWIYYTAESGSDISKTKDKLKEETIICRNYIENLNLMFNIFNEKIMKEILSKLDLAVEMIAVNDIFGRIEDVFRTYKEYVYSLLNEVECRIINMEGNTNE